MSEKMLILDLDERWFIDSMLSRVLDWDDDDRLEEICEDMKMSGKDLGNDFDDEEYKIYVRTTLKKLRRKLTS